MIEFKNVNKFFRKKRETIQALKNVSFKIDQHDIFGVIGYSGAGKSTLVRLVNQLETVSDGQVIVDGHEIDTYKEKDLREIKKDIGMIFQHFNLLNSKSVYKNVAMPLILSKTNKKEIKEKVDEMLEFVGLADKKDQFPDELSGGQKQRVGIARALANDPDVLLCDEATSALDPQTTDEILDLLLKVREQQNLTIVLITHEMHVIRRICDEVAVMENGKVIEQGAVSKVFENPQHEVTKRFVKDDLNDDFEDSLEYLEPLDHDAYIVRLNFTGDNTTEPIISYMTKTHNIDVNILEADIKNTKNGSLGFLVIHIPHISEEHFKQFKHNLHEQHVNVEVLRHG